MTAPRRCIKCRQDAIGGTSRCRDHQPKSSWGKYIKAHPDAAEFYRSAGWRMARHRQLADHPFCAVCGAKATAADHILNRAAGGADLAPSNLQSLCKPHHNAKTIAESHRGRKRR